MEQPSQEYPPWLTPVPSVVTDAAGFPVATVIGVSYIAPTYYGPSIPLGTLYSYGGSTYPPTVVWSASSPPTTTSGVTTTPATTEVSGASTTTGVTPITPEVSTTVLSTVTTTVPPTTATTPTTTTPLTTIATTSGISVMSPMTSEVTSTPSVIATVTPSTPTSSSSASSTLTTSTISSHSGASSTVSAVSSSLFPPISTGISPVTGLTKGQLVGIVVASVLGLIFLFVLALFLFLWFKALKNRRQYATISPIDGDYVEVPPGGRLPGEGSPRHSGEEHDSLLRARAEISAAAASSRPRAAQATSNSNSSQSTNSHASGFGVLLDKPSIGFSPNIPEELRVGRPLSPSELESLGREDVLPEETRYDDGYTGAYAYSRSPAIPRLDPAAAPLLGSAGLAVKRSKSSLPGEPEEATVHTARRVKVEDLAPRELADPSSSRKSSNGILSAIGLGGLANLARKSWFKHFESPRQSVPAHGIEALSEKDIEAGQDPFVAERAVDSFGIRTRGTGVAESQNGTRPVSRVSARSGASGATLYHDAQSSLQGGTSSLTPPPRALTPVDQPAMPEQTWASSPLAGPPVYEDRPPVSSTPSRNDSQTSFEFPAGVDILDMPAPTALNHFASISSMKDSASGGSFGIKPLIFPPPGLETIRAIGWADSPTGSGSHSPHGFITGMHIPGPGDLDILEDAPPEAENGWRSMAMDPNRRGTFGTYVQGPDFASEQASLHSMRSHFSPSTPRSTGSAPVGRFEMASVNSNASRPSAHSRSASSGMHSLIHQGSISSDNRKKNGSATHSPALSVFGIRPSSRGSPGLDQSFDSTIIGTPPIVHVSPQKSDTVRSIASGSTTLVDISMRTLRGFSTPPRSDSTSPLSTSTQLNPPPWAGGLANDWQPAP